jgi:hypothetical protein
MTIHVRSLGHLKGKKKIKYPLPPVSSDMPWIRKSFASCPSQESHLDATHAAQFESGWNITAINQPIETETRPSAASAAILDSTTARFFR